MYLQQVLLPGDGGQVSYTEMPLLHAAADTEEEAGLHQVTMQQADGAGSFSRAAVFGVGEATVLSAEVHHEPELPERPHGAEQGDQQILVGVPRDVADEHLTAGSWGGSIPH